MFSKSRYILVLHLAVARSLKLLTWLYTTLMIFYYCIPTILTITAVHCYLPENKSNKWRVPILWNVVTYLVSAHVQCQNSGSTVIRVIIYSICQLFQVFKEYNTAMDKHFTHLISNYIICNVIMSIQAFWMKAYLFPCPRTISYITVCSLCKVHQVNANRDNHVGPAVHLHVSSSKEN